MNEVTNRCIVLDTETTGLDPKQGHRIIEIGCIELVNRIPTGVIYHQYINPARKVDPGAFKVHGIGNDFLADKPTFSEIYSDFFDFIDGTALIIHNAPFDCGFIDAEFKRIKKSHAKINSRCEIIDTLLLARKKHPGQRNNLDALCKRYHIDNSKRHYHGALLDAEILANVYLQMTRSQDNFFDDFSEKNQQENTNKKQGKRSENHFDDLNLKVIYATEAEEKAHADYLERLKED